MLGLTGFKDTQTSTSITIGAATIEGKDVNVTGLSSTAKTANLTQNLTDSRSIAMADLTGNGLMDMIVGNYDGPVEIYLNNGTSDPFNGVTPIVLTNSDASGGLADPTVGLAVGDVTGNGRQDLIVANQGATHLPLPQHRQRDQPVRRRLPHRHRQRQRDVGRRGGPDQQWSSRPHRRRHVHQSE